MRMRNFFVSFAMILMLAAGGYWGYLNYLAPAPASQAPSPSRVVERQPDLSSIQGKVVPGRYARLSFNAAGLVKEIQVEKGQRVRAGQVLAELQNSEKMEAAVTEAEVELLSAQKGLSDLFKESDLAAAQAQMAVAEAQKAVREAQRRIDGLQSRSLQADLDGVFAEIVVAEDKLERAQRNFTPYERWPEDNVIRARLLSQVAEAQRVYDDLVKKQTDLENTSMDTDLAQAEAQAELAIARARLEAAQQDFQTLQSGPDPEDIALAEARLANARTQLAAARADLKNLRLRAPFSGVVISMNLKAGEYARAGEPAILLANTDDWKIETTNLSEKGIGLLETGMPARIRLPAFPEKIFEGAVQEVDLRGQENGEDVAYTATLTFKPGQTPLRWGMTAEVHFPRSQP